MPNHARRTDVPTSQDVTIPCPECGELVECRVEYGTFSDVTESCLLECHKASRYAYDQLADAACMAALAERHDFEWGG